MSIKRYEMTDAQWEQICHLFLVAKTGHPPKDNQLMFNAILWIARSGAVWRDIPECYGSWKTVYGRFCKWRDDSTLLTLSCALNADYEKLSTGSTIIKTHQHDMGAKKGSEQQFKPAYRKKPWRKYHKNPHNCGWVGKSSLLPAFQRKSK